MECQICKKKDLKRYVDGKTISGCWAYLCEECHLIHGKGFGLGKGQMYDDRGRKIEG